MSRYPTRSVNNQEDQASTSTMANAGTNSIASRNNNIAPIALALLLATAGALASALRRYERQRRSKWIEEDNELRGKDTTHSIIDHFKSLILDPSTSVEEANKKRTLT